MAAKEKEDVDLSIYDASCEIKERQQEMLDYAVVSVIAVYYITFKLALEVLKR